MRAFLSSASLALTPTLSRTRERGRGALLMRLIDSHCHLDFPDFADEIEGVVARAQERRRRAAW